MSSASNIDVAMRFALALADRLLESHDVDVVTARLRDRLRATPEGEDLLLIDILGVLTRHAGRPKTKAFARH